MTLKTIAVGKKRFCLFMTLITDLTKSDQSQTKSSVYLFNLYYTKKVPLRLTNPFSNLEILGVLVHFKMVSVWNWELLFFLNCVFVCACVCAIVSISVSFSNICFLKKGWNHYKQYLKTVQTCCSAKSAFSLCLSVVETLVKKPICNKKKVKIALTIN